ncbi:MAG: nucleotidyltransferase domain-containing protein [Planctomycetes bacterium]|nr:nucleotidyltransferase domain-containing protein [Planctomycetota bacterium]
MSAMKKPTPRIKYSKKELIEFCKRNRIKRLAFFGSVLRDDFGPDSDVDVLYEFEPDAIVGWDIVTIEEELSKLLGGRKIDFVPFKYISKYIRRRVLKEAQLQYAA